MSIALLAIMIILSASTLSYLTHKNLSQIHNTIPIVCMSIIICMFVIGLAFGIHTAFIITVGLMGCIIIGGGTRYIEIERQ